MRTVIKTTHLILSPCRENGFSIKKVPHSDIEMWLLSYLNCDYIKLSSKARKRLIAQGYHIKDWDLTEEG